MPKCSVCTHPQSSEITKAIANGVSLGNVSSQYGVSKPAAHRHSQKCLGRGVAAQNRANPPGRTKARGTSRIGSTPGATTRCLSCGIDASAADAKALIQRAERLLFHAETIVQRASEDENYRLLLSALDRATKASETMLRAASVGGFGPAEGVNVNIGINGAPPANSIAQLSIEELRSLSRLASTDLSLDELRTLASAPIALPAAAVIESELAENGGSNGGTS
ncbi:MAG: hypothetical protein WCB99_04140 [Candidatus Cybelea sp.]